MEFFEFAVRLATDPAMAMTFILIVVVVGGFIWLRMHTITQEQITDSYTDIVKSLQQLVIKTTGEVFELNAEVRRLNAQTFGLQERLQKSEDRQNVLEKERAKLIAERVKMIDHIRGLTAKARDDDGRIKRLESDLHAANIKIADLERRLKNYETGDLENGDIL